MPINVPYSDKFDFSTFEKLIAFHFLATVITKIEIANAVIKKRIISINRLILVSI